MAGRRKREVAEDDVRRITRLFELRGRTLSTAELCDVARCSPDLLDSLAADGTITGPSAGQFTWNDAAYVAAHVRWTPRHIATALAQSPLRHEVPDPNRYSVARYVLPSYQQTLLMLIAECERGEKTGFAASDLLERIVADFFEGEVVGMASGDGLPQIRAALAWPMECEDDNA